MVLFEKQKNVGILTMNKPETLNALSVDMLKSLDEAFDKALNDDEVYVIVITGGGKAFVAGADISQMKDFDPVSAKKFSEYGNKVFLKIENSEKPVIAAVNGFALGGGCELALAADIRIASEKAKFGQPEVTLGITPGFGGTQRLARQIHMAAAKELIFTGEVINAERALQIGLVNKVTPHDELMGEALKLADKICANAQIAVRQSKLAVERGLRCDIETGAAFEAEAFGICFATQDQKDAMTAFVNKTKLEKFKNK